MKAFRILARFPELSAAHSEQECKVEAASLARAACLGIETLKENPHVKGRHVTRVTMTIQFLHDLSPSLFPEK